MDTLFFAWSKPIQKHAPKKNIDMSRRKFGSPMKDWGIGEGEPDMKNTGIQRIIFKNVFIQRSKQINAKKNP